MFNRANLKLWFINGVNTFLIGSSLILVFGFIIWFIHGTLIVSTSAQLMTEGWEALVSVMALFLSVIVPSIITLFGFFVIAVLLWWISRVFAQYEEFQPTASIVHQVAAPVGLITGAMLTLPILLPYATMQVFNGKGPELFAEVKQVTGLISPPEPKYMTGNLEAEPSKYLE